MRKSYVFFLISLYFQGMMKVGFVLHKVFFQKIGNLTIYNHYILISGGGIGIHSKDLFYCYQRYNYFLNSTLTRGKIKYPLLIFQRIMVFIQAVPSSGH